MQRLRKVTFAPISGSSGIRNHNLRCAKPMLCQIELWTHILVDKTGLEPVTFCLQSSCATKLRHKPKNKTDLTHLNAYYWLSVSAYGIRTRDQRPSHRLFYRRTKCVISFSGHIWDSNPWRSACKADILPTELMAQILVLRPGFEPGLSDRKSDGLNRWPNGAYFVVPSSGVEPDFWDFQSRPFPRLDAMA